MHFHFKYDSIFFKNFIITPTWVFNKKQFLEMKILKRERERSLAILVDKSRQIYSKFLTAESVSCFVKIQLKVNCSLYFCSISVILLVLTRVFLLNRLPILFRQLLVSWEVLWTQKQGTHWSVPCWQDCQVELGMERINYWKP